MDALKNIIGDYERFLMQILQETREAGFLLSDFVQLDHMCYRVSSLEQYNDKKTQLLTLGNLLSETMVNGRPIAVFRLHSPILFDGWRIDAIELPAPKSDVATSEGLEHIEFVLYDDKEVFLQKYAGKEFILRAADRGVNPEIGYKLPNYTVKFHLLNLPTAVYLQNKLGFTNIKDGQ